MPRGGSFVAGVVRAEIEESVEKAEFGETGAGFDARVFVVERGRSGCIGCLDLPLVCAGSRVSA